MGLVAGYLATTQILVNGTLTDLGTALTNSGNGYNSFTLIQVNSGGELIASNTTFSVDELNLVNGSRMNPGDLTSDVFDLPIYVPFQDVRLSNNQSFQDVYINGGTMANGQSLSLVPMGTVSMANLVYIVSGGFTVARVQCWTREPVLPS